MNFAERFSNYLLTDGNLKEALEVYDHTIHHIQSIPPAGTGLHFTDESIFFFLSSEMYRGAAEPYSETRCFTARDEDNLRERLFILAESPQYQPLQSLIARALTEENKSHV